MEISQELKDRLGPVITSFEAKPRRVIAVPYIEIQGDHTESMQEALDILDNSFVFVRYEPDKNGKYYLIANRDDVGRFLEDNVFDFVDITSELINKWKKHYQWIFDLGNGEELRKYFKDNNLSTEIRFGCFQILE